MAIAPKYFPFDAGLGKNVTESQWGKMARLWRLTGVHPTLLDKFETYADSSGMQVKVKSGVAWMEGFYYEYDDVQILAIAASNPTNPRIDRVVVRVDWDNNIIALGVLTGTPAVTPTVPVLTQSSTIWEISLAQVAVAAGATTIAAGNVTDERVYSYAETQILSNHNAIINGAMDIWQRGMATLTNPVTGTYFPDRFSTVHVLGDGTFNLLQSAETPSMTFPFQFSLEHQTTHIETSVAVGEYSRIDYRMEGYDFKRFEGQTVTLSFWVKSVKTGIFCVAFRNSANDKSYVHEFTVNNANTWEQKTVTLTFNSGGTFLYTSGIGLNISWTIMAGSTFQTATANKDTWQAGNFFATSVQVNGMDNTNNKFYLTGVQMELGSNATPFEFKSFQQELEKCKRYYERIAPGIALGFYAAGYSASTTNARFVLYYTEKRILPASVTMSNVTKFAVNTSGGGIAGTAYTAYNIGIKACSIQVTVASGLITDQGCVLAGENNATSHYIEVSAEL